MRLWPLLLLILAACSGTQDEILTDSEAEAEARATQECLENPELSREWGECNVKKTIYNRMPRIRNCYQKQASAKYDFRGDLILKIRVFPSGKVREVKVEEGSLKNKMLSSCLVREISRLRFAKPPKGINPVIYFPFTLEQVKP